MAAARGLEERWGRVRVSEVGVEGAGAGKYNRKRSNCRKRRQREGAKAAEAPAA